MHIRQYIESDLDAILSSWEASTRLAHSFMTDEVGAIFLQPECHGKGAGKALMDKAQEIHGDLEVEVFKENAIGRKFYSRYGFSLVEEKLHEPTGQQMLRLKFTAEIRSV